MSNEPLDVNDALRAGRDVRAELLDAEPVEAGQDAGTEPINLDADAPTFADAYGPDRLDEDRKRDTIPIGKLPPWPDYQPAGKAPASDGEDKRDRAGHGWGDDLNRALGGLLPGYILAVGAPAAGAGKTAFVAQLADGLALRTAGLASAPGPEPLTPVVWLSEMGVDALSWRSLSRWTGKDARIYRAGLAADRFLPEGAADTNAAFKEAKAALQGDFGAARKFIRYVRPDKAPDGADLVDWVAKIVNAWREDLATKHKRPVWVTVMLDPAQRWQATNMGEVEALNHLIEHLGDVARRDEWSVVLTSDTNKSTAQQRDRSKSDNDPAVAAFRGSYKLFHLADAAVYLDRWDPHGATLAEWSAGPNAYELDGNGALMWTTISASIVKNRWGPNYSTPSGRTLLRWHVRNGRFLPLGRVPREATKDEEKEWDAAQKARLQAAAEATANAAAGGGAGKTVPGFPGGK